MHTYPHTHIYCTFIHTVNAQLVLFNLHTNNTTLHFQIACSADIKVQFCMQGIRPAFGETRLEKMSVRKVDFRNVCNLRHIHNVI